MSAYRICLLILFHLISTHANEFNLSENVKVLNYSTPEMHEKCEVYAFLKMKPLILRLKALQTTIEEHILQSNNESNTILTLQNSNDEEDKIKTLNSEIMSSQSKLTEKDNQIAALKSALQALLMRIGNDKNHIDNLTAELNSKNLSYKAKENELLNNESKLKSLEATISQLNYKISNLTESLTKAEINVNTLKNNNNNINNDLKSTNINYQTKVNELFKSESNVKSLEATVAQLNNKISSLLKKEIETNTRQSKFDNLQNGNYT